MRAGISSLNNSSRRSGMFRLSRAAAGRLEPRCAAAPGEFSHSQNIALALGHRYRAAGGEQIEPMGPLDALIISRKRHKMPVTGHAPLEQRHTFRFGVP